MNGPRLHFLQHVTFERPACIGTWARRHGLVRTATALHEGEPLPAVDAFDWLVVLGGPMGVADTAAHPWLEDERRLIAQALEAGRRVLGICLGAQQLAAVLGARVYRAPVREVGWFPVRETAACAGTPYAGFLGGEAMVMHWHGDTFDLPPSAVHLAASEACAQQAFACGRALGLQFHLELDRPAVERLIAACPQDLEPGPWVQTPAAMLTEQTAFAAAPRLLERLLDRWLAEDRGRDQADASTAGGCGGRAAAGGGAGSRSHAPSTRVMCDQVSPAFS